ncbi:hypothetical protein [Xanthomonas arboricola]|uniref:hypothetical protein n=1 Tax=Xanthomonas arboricola TaxID=56448 RepID=UPI000C81D697|nr:hypothetical protein [Xanthomonas arboricola]PPT19607.1 hypothetical protein XarCFBP6771_12655 [Xanthomonas arboricola]PPT59993.1 hypothetical protein XarbCFBP8153_06145 [Xanthomonas arboricola]
MPLLILTPVAIFLLILMPPTFSVMFGVLAIVVTLTVKITAQMIVGGEVGLYQSLKAVASSLVLSSALLLAFLSAGRGHVVVGPVLFVLLAASYVLGFKIALNIELLPSVLIAAVSTAVSIVLIVGMRTMLFLKILNARIRYHQGDTPCRIKRGSAAH